MTEAITLTIHQVERLIQIADAAGVKQGVDVVGPHDTVVVELIRQRLEKAKEITR